MDKVAQHFTEFQRYKPLQHADKVAVTKAGRIMMLSDCAEGRIRQAAFEI